MFNVKMGQAAFVTNEKWRLTLLRTETNGVISLRWNLWNYSNTVIFGHQNAVINLFQLLGYLWYFAGRMLTTRQAAWIIQRFAALDTLYYLLAH